MKKKKKNIVLIKYIWEVKKYNFFILRVNQHYMLHEAFRGIFKDVFELLTVLSLYLLPRKNKEPLPF